MDLLSILIGALNGGALTAGGWWMRSRRARHQQAATREVYALSERVLGAASTAEVASALSEALPSILGATSVHLYLFNARTRCLERVANPAGAAPLAASLDDPPDGMPRAAVTCFRDRTRLSIADARRNPLIQAASYEDLPRSALFVPLLSSGEPVGVLEVDDAAHVGYFSPQEQEAVQHLANLAAAALRFEQQQHLREQLFRGERLAATGSLISGVARELREPVENIARLTAVLTAAHGRCSGDSLAGQLNAAVQRASEIVARLVSFANADHASPAEVDAASLLAELVRFREPRWQAGGLRVQNRTCQDPAPVLGVAGQLEQVLLTLLVLAEQGAVQSQMRTLMLRTTVLAGRVLIEIGHSSDAGPEGGPPNTLLPEAGALDLEVCEGIIRNHGGEIRRLHETGMRGFAVDLPLAATAASKLSSPRAPAAATRPMTFLLVNPDRSEAHQWMSLLSRRGHRVVPASAEEAPDLAQRIRFHALFWAAGPRRSDWTGFRDRVRNSVGAFVLVSDIYDRQLADSLQGNGCYLLGRPVEEAALDQVLEQIAARGVYAG